MRHGRANLIELHAPVIFPGVLGISIPFRRLFYVHLVLLHAGLVVRIVGDLTDNFTVARWGGLLNATAIGLFLLATIASAAVARVVHLRGVPSRPGPPTPLRPSASAQSRKGAVTR